MAARTRLGLPFTYNENWIGGTYYVLNLIEALKSVESQRQPEIVILAEKPEHFEHVKEVKYPYAKYYPAPAPTGLRGKVKRAADRFIHLNFRDERPDPKVIDITFGARDFSFVRRIPVQLVWIPDFQERHYPQFFSPRELKVRKKWTDHAVAKKFPIVFSSRNAQQDFLTFYPNASSKTYVLPFAVTHPEYQSLDFADIKQKYRINRPYFFAPNQFWIHKNHQVILDAVLKLKSLNFQIFFSGRENDYRHPGYVDQLKSFVMQNGLSDHIRFLGFIDRREQLKLMSQARAVIQPSLFEGWSTVVEDAKAMNQFILLSDIPVHREQVQTNATFFNPHSAEELSQALMACLDSAPCIIPVDYRNSIRLFGERFLDIVDSAVC